MLKLFRLALFGLLTTIQAGFAEPMSREGMSVHVFAPMMLGEAVTEDGVYELLNAGGGHVGYAFETEPMAPLPGFSGAPINLLVQVDLEGRFLDVRLIAHNEPIFVSGLGEAAFHAFVAQYKGHSIADSLVVGTPYGSGAEGSGLVYLDGVTKATASVRIAHESILAATLQVAREKMAGVAAGPPAYPDPDHEEVLTWDNLVTQGIAQNRVWTNAEVDAAFAGTLWANDDPEAKAAPDDPYLDLWVVDLGPKSIARAVLAPESFDELQSFLEISESDEPILVLDAARHGLVSDAFVRNTAPDWISAEQGGFPVALRDADLFFELHPDIPDALHDAVDKGQALILRTDRRLGFDPTAPWTLTVKAVREHGVFKPEIGSIDLVLEAVGPERFFVRQAAAPPPSPLQAAVLERASDLVVLAGLLVGLFGLLAWRLEALSTHRAFQTMRLAFLAFMLCFIGWWGQGQLSIVTPLATIQTAMAGGSFAFLLYDPFSLLLWVAAILGLVLWGRGLFCGWLCPFGALQEFAAKIGGWLRITPIVVPPEWDRPLRGVKYVVLAGLIGVAVFAPGQIDKAAEVEPFKTAITTVFLREWYYVAYAVFWLFLSMVLFKGFCRYVCPLGALLAIGGVFRQKDWIARRQECGSPCQLCRVKCAYGAIKPTGEIDYAECFQCLDCVTIHETPTLCVPQILVEKRGRRLAAE